MLGSLYCRMWLETFIIPKLDLYKHSLFTTWCGVHQLLIWNFIFVLLFINWSYGLESFMISFPAYEHYMLHFKEKIKYLHVHFFWSMHLLIWNFFKANFYGKILIHFISCFPLFRNKEVKWFWRFKFNAFIVY